VTAINNGGLVQGTFVITPPLREDILTTTQVTLIKSSTHTTTALETYAGTGYDALDIYPDISQDYAAGATVTLVNTVIDPIAQATAYTDVFGLSTGDFDTNTVSAAITVTGSIMSVAVSDTTPAGTAFNSDRANAGRTGNAGEGSFNVVASESIDMGGFLSDLSHDDAQSVLGRNAVDANGNAITPVTATELPDLRVDYEDVQDANFNSWAKVENYDQYDNSGTPELVGVDALVPKLQQDDSSLGSDNTFLYDVTTASGITLAAAHANADATDADSIYTYDSTAGAAPGVNNEDDYPLFHFWGYNSTTSATTVTASRAVLKLSGVTTIDAQYAQAYIYSPDNTAHDIGEALTEAEAENIITASLIVDDSASAAQGNAGMVDEENDATVSATGVTAPALLVGIPAYGGATWDSDGDILVVEDVVLDGVPHTLHFTIPSHTTTELTSDVLEIDNLPTMKVYRKVSLAGLDLLGAPPSDNDNAHLRAGNTVTVDLAPNAFTFTYREDLASVNSSISYTTGSDFGTTAGNNTDDRVTFTSTSAALNATNANQVDVNFDFNTEGASPEIGHGATFTVVATDFDGESSSFTITLNVGHGFLGIDGGAANAVDTVNDGVADEAADGYAEIVDPILNVISGNAVE